MSIPRPLIGRLILVSLLAVVYGCSNDSSGLTSVNNTSSATPVGGNAGTTTSSFGGTTPASSNSGFNTGTGGISGSGGSNSPNVGGTGGLSQANTVGGASPATSINATGGTNATSTKAIGGVKATGGANATSTKATGGAKATGGTSATATGGTNATTGGGSSGKGLTLYYIRHAQVVANTLEPDQVTLENSETITDLGLRQIDALTTYLKAMNVAPDAVLVSPTKRAQKTIEPYLVAQNLQGEIWMELAECCNTSPTGAALPTAPTIQTYFAATIEGQNLAFRDAAANKYWKTDTYEEGLFMEMTARDAILSRYGQSGKTIFVVGHAAAGLVMIGLLQGNDMLQGSTSTGPNAVYLLNTGVMRLIQDPTTGLFKLDGRNINNPAQE